MISFRNLLLSLALVANAGSLSILHAQSELPKPIGAGLVHDFAGWLTKSEAESLDRKLIAYNDSSSNQIVIIIVDDLLGYTPNDYASRIGEEWGVGRKGIDNGIVVLVKPSGGTNEREAYIAVGYGLEGAIPDITANHIVQNEMLPNFREGRNFEGLDRATSVLMELANGEYSAADYEDRNKKSHLPLILLMILAGIFFFLMPSVNAMRYARVNHITFWAAMLLLNQQRSKNNKWDDFRGGRGPFMGGGFGGGGGGGFGGFGGGSFGGGGAGGSW